MQYPVSYPVSYLVSCPANDPKNRQPSQRVLVIDDSADNREILKLLLDSNGFSTDCAPNGEEALSFMKGSLDLPALILLDANMPVMDGYQFRIEQDKDQRLKDIPVVVMSGDHDPNMEERMNHPHSFLSKPFNMQNVVGHVSAFFGA